MCFHIKHMVELRGAYLLLLLIALMTLLCPGRMQSCDRTRHAASNAYKLPEAPKVKLAAQPVAQSVEPDEPSLIVQKTMHTDEVVDTKLRGSSMNIMPRFLDLRRFQSPNVNP